MLFRPKRLVTFMGRNLRPTDIVNITNPQIIFKIKQSGAFDEVTIQEMPKEVHEQPPSAETEKSASAGKKKSSRKPKATGSEEEP